jgi:beta-lactamase class A
MVKGQRLAVSYGVVNDVAIAWPPVAAPIVLAVLSARPTMDAKGDNLLIAQAATVIADELGRAG